MALTRCATCPRYTNGGRTKCHACDPKGTTMCPCATCGRYTRTHEGDTPTCTPCRKAAMRRTPHPRGPRLDSRGQRYEPVPGDLPAHEIEAIIEAELARLRHARQVGE